MADYKTLKDLPGIKAGAIFRWIEKSKLYNLIYSKENQNGWTFSKSTVENNKDWFEEIK